MGGVDWSGLPLWSGYYGVRNVAGLIHRLEVLHLHLRSKKA